MQKLEKNSLNKKSNCLLGEAVQGKVVIFLGGLKFINELALDHFILLKSDNFGGQYPRISL